jgi:hypothetical protein
VARGAEVKKVEEGNRVGRRVTLFALGVDLRDLLLA